MGVTLFANGNPRTFDMGAGGFLRLRCKLASIWDKEFGEHYAKLPFIHEKAGYEEFDRKTLEIFSDPRFKEEDQDLVDFFFESDCKGSIGYKTCGKLYNLIKDVDFGGAIFTYVAYSDGKDYEYLKEFFKECYSRRRKAFWR